jgi:hypothetical protein
MRRLLTGYAVSFNPPEADKGLIPRRLSEQSRDLSAYGESRFSGAAGSFIRRHNRHGHFFQNRYKSIICQEDVYLREPVRYIHLNPVRELGLSLTELAQLLDISLPAVSYSVERGETIAYNKNYRLINQNLIS